MLTSRVGPARSVGASKLCILLSSHCRRPLGAIRGTEQGSTPSRRTVGVLLGDRMILMPARSAKNPLHPDVPPPGMSVFATPCRTRATFSQTAMLERREVEGTVHAAIEPGEVHSYSLAGEPTIVASGYGSVGVSRALGRSKTTATPRAVDLISELQAISGQVNRMMAQVERAIDRLAVHAG